MEKNTRSVKSKEFLTLEQKLEVLKQLDRGLSERAVAFNFKVSRSQINRIRANRVKIERFIQEKIFQPNVKVLKNAAHHPELDSAVFKWFCEMRSPVNRRKPLPISRAIIQARALLEASRRNIDNFQASDGWFRNWRRRFNVGPSVKLHGEAGDVNISELEPTINRLRSQLGKYDPKNVFNADETAQYYRALPFTTYIAPSENRQTARGSKALRAKDRLTLMLCVNATGDCKIEPLVIGSAKNPHCFRDGAPPISYKGQTNAWMDRTLFSFWFHDIFLRAVRNWTEEPAVLLLDNCAGHDPDIADPLGQVEVIYLPPNVTSVYQPLDQGVIASQKACYRKLLLMRLVETSELSDELAEEASLAKRGRKGLRYGCPATVLDACQLIKKSWDTVTAETVSNCWRHAKILPHSEFSIARAAPRHSGQHLVRSTTEFLCSLLESQTGNQSTNLGVIRDVINSMQVSTDRESVIQHWLNLESDPGVIALDDTELVEDIDQTLNSTCNGINMIDDEHSFSVAENDLSMNSLDSNTNNCFLTKRAHENLIKEKLLKYACAAIDANFSDGVLNDLALKIKSHLS